MTMSKNAIESPTTSKEGFKKVVRLRQMDTFKADWFVPSKQMALKQSNNAQGRPWTALKPSMFACGFLNGPANFKAVGQLWLVTYMLCQLA